MLVAKIRDGRIETDEPIPELWEGLTVQVVPVTPDVASDNVEQRMQALRDLGAAEFDEGEELEFAEALSEIDRRSREEITRWMRKAAP